MIFYSHRENRLYLDTWNYNRCRIMTALEKIVKKAGGRVKPGGTAIISHRDADPDKTINVTQAGYIVFEYEGMVYSYNTDDNPFFDFTYSKTPVVNGKYSRDVYCDKDDARVYSLANSKDIYYGAEGLADEDVEEGAQKLFDFLIKAPVSKKCIGTHKIRVRNLYDNGFHMETVRDPERLADMWEDTVA